ncbi:hypothetical protein BT96DRAFT_924652 [Gymnopus androsaceus JB14]|uniref:Protein argonaute N-terminal domain-containing protein n=1 Tax=Gymnopus androsaceus JB14 TaxID=1447944 RepID=A0A6A4H4B9_9AGAR|nr:hypothetical protein BT96DRAFT_924652 [Gymnopus androsaceus JB14]
MLQSLTTTPSCPAQQGGFPQGSRGKKGSGRKPGNPPRGGPPQIVGTGRGAQMAGGVQPSRSQTGPVASMDIDSDIASAPVGVPKDSVHGRKIIVLTNASEASVPENIIYHYDGVIEKRLPPKVNRMLLEQLQLEPEFHPGGAYDGKKNLFMPHRIDFGGSAKSRVYQILMNGNHQRAEIPPPVYKVTISEAAHFFEYFVVFCP